MLLRNCKYVYKRTVHYSNLISIFRKCHTVISTKDDVLYFFIDCFASMHYHNLQLKDYIISLFVTLLMLVRSIFVCVFHEW